MAKNNYSLNQIDNNTISSIEELEMKRLDGFTDATVESYKLIADYGVTAKVGNFIDFSPYSDILSDDEINVLNNLRYDEFLKFAEGNVNYATQAYKDDDYSIVKRLKSDFKQGFDALFPEMSAQRDRNKLTEARKAYNALTRIEKEKGITLNDFKLEAQKNVKQQEERLNAATEESFITGNAGLFVGAIAGDITEAGVKATRGDLIHIGAYLLPAGFGVKGASTLKNLTNYTVSGFALNAATEAYLQFSDYKDFEQDFLGRQFDEIEALKSSAFGGLVGGALAGGAYGLSRVVSSNGRKVSLNNFRNNISSVIDEEIQVLRDKTDEEIEIIRKQKESEIISNSINYNLNKVNDKIDSSNKRIDRDIKKINDNQKLARDTYIAYDRELNALDNSVRTEQQLNESFELSEKIKQENNIKLNKLENDLKELEDLRDGKKNFRDISLKENDTNYRSFNNGNPIEKEIGARLGKSFRANVKLGDKKTVIEAEIERVKRDIENIKSEKYLTKEDLPNFKAQKEYFEKRKQNQNEILETDEIINSEIELLNKEVNDITINENNDLNIIRDDIKKSFKKLDEIESKIEESLSKTKRNADIYINDFDNYKSRFEAEAKALYKDNKKRSAYVNKNLTDRFGTSNKDKYVEKVNKDLKTINYAIREYFMKDIRVKQLELLKIVNNTGKKEINNLLNSIKDKKSIDNLLEIENDIISKQNEINAFMDDEYIPASKILSETQKGLEARFIPDSVDTFRNTEALNVFVDIKGIVDEFDFINKTEIAKQQVILLNKKLEDISFDIDKINQPIIKKGMQRFFGDDSVLKVDSIIENSLFKNEFKFLKDNRQEMLDLVNKGASFDDIKQVIIDKVNDYNNQISNAKQVELDIIKREQELENIKVDNNISDIPELNDFQKGILNKAEKVYNNKEFRKKLEDGLEQDVLDNSPFKRIDDLEENLKQLEDSTSCMLR